MWHDSSVSDSEPQHISSLTRLVLVANSLCTVGSLYFAGVIYVEVYVIYIELER